MLLVLALGATGGAQTLSCPATLGVRAPAGWTLEGKPPATARKFERISLYNKDVQQEYDLAPDDEAKVEGRIVQIWGVDGYRQLPLYLRCRYHGTETTISREIPAALKKCRFRFTLDKKGNIVGDSEVKCQ